MSRPNFTVSVRCLYNPSLAIGEVRIGARIVYSTGFVADIATAEAQAAWFVANCDSRGRLR